MIFGTYDFIIGFRFYDEPLNAADETEIAVEYARKENNTRFALEIPKSLFRNKKSIIK